MWSTDSSPCSRVALVWDQQVFHCQYWILGSLRAMKFSMDYRTNLNLFKIDVLLITTIGFIHVLSDYFSFNKYLLKTSTMSTGI